MVKEKSGKMTEVRGNVGEICCPIAVTYVTFRDLTRYCVDIPRCINKLCS